jgi:hypothetical protein
VGEEKWEYWKYDMSKVVIIGYVYKSQQNGAVYDMGGYPRAFVVDVTLE